MSAQNGAGFPQQLSGRKPAPVSYSECWSDEPVASNVVELVIGNNLCNHPSVTELDLTKYPNLKRFTIGDDCFMNVNEGNLIGVNAL